MEFNPAVVERFIRAFEAVSGVAHVASAADDVGEKAFAVIRDKQAVRVALAGLPSDIAQAIEARCVANGVEVVREPFSASTLPGAIDAAQVGITGIAFAIAQTGTLVEVASNDAVRLVSALPRTHIGIVRAADLVGEYSEAAPRVRALFAENPENCVVSFMSGPSRTGDIELKLTLGVHGPESAHAIVVLE